MTNDGIQLNLFISRAGICSRRAAVDIIKKGHVSVNDKVITEPGFRVIQGDIVKYKDQTIKPEQKIYILLNKPKGYVTTVSDEKMRKTVMDLVKVPGKERLFPVGRLDRDTTGLIIITNDGDLSQALAHPRNNVPKRYYVVLDKPVEISHIEQLKKGVYLDDGRAKIDKIRYTGKTKKHVAVEIHGGKNRIIKRIFAHVGLKVLALDRFAIATITKQGLPVGRWRYLTEAEIQEIQKKN